MAANYVAMVPSGQVFDRLYAELLLFIHLYMITCIMWYIEQIDNKEIKNIIVDNPITPTQIFLLLFENQFAGKASGLHISCWLRSGKPFSFFREYKFRR